MTNKHSDADQPQLVIKVAAGGKLLGFVAIDEMVRGRVYGGLRMASEMPGVRLIESGNHVERFEADSKAIA